MPQWEAAADTVSVENLGTRDSLSFPPEQVSESSMTAILLESARDGGPSFSVMTVPVQCRLLDLYKNRILLPLWFITQVDLLSPGMPNKDLKETSWNQLFQNLGINQVRQNKDKYTKTVYSYC